MCEKQREVNNNEIKLLWKSDMQIQKKICDSITK